MSSLVLLMSGAMLAPALASIEHDLDATQAEGNMILAIYILAFSFGPMILGPCTEVFGRRVVWLGAESMYILWSTAAGFSQTKGMLLAFRVLNGFAASSGFVTASPVLADIWRSEERGLSYMLSAVVPMMGPAIGPILGGVISEKANWRWIFWTLSLFDAVLVVIGFCFLPETYGVVLLGRKAAKLRKETGLPYYYAKSKGKEYAMRDTDPLRKRLLHSLARPIKLLATHPFIQVMALCLAFQFGLMYIMLATLATIAIDRYGQSQLASGLHYIAFIIGNTIAAQLGGALMDKVWARLTKKGGGSTTSPEFRVPLMLPGIVLLPVGMLVYGWAAAHRWHWIVVDVGIAIFGCGVISNQQAMQAYVTESYLDYVASATAASQFLRFFAGFGFPIFAPAMFDRLGYGWANTMLAGVYLVIAAPAPPLLWYYGARLRARGGKLD